MLFLLLGTDAAEPSVGGGEPLADDAATSAPKPEPGTADGSSQRQGPIPRRGAPLQVSQGTKLHIVSGVIHNIDVFITLIQNS